MSSQGGGERNQKHFFDRTFTLHFRPSRQLTRSNAVVVPKTPEQHLDLPTILQKTVKLTYRIVLSQGIFLCSGDFLVVGINL